MSWMTTHIKGQRPDHPQKPVVITHLNDVLPRVHANKGLKVYTTGPFTVVVYAINAPEVFAEDVDFEARGLLFDTQTGQLLSRPLHKAFGFDERRTPEDIPFEKGAWIEDKIDGSMVAGFVWDHAANVHTKSGVTKHAKMAQQDLRAQHKELIQAAWKDGFTPSFEWTTPHNRIVIGHDVVSFTLLAMRDRQTGRYDFEARKTYSERFDVPLPKTLAHLNTPQEARDWAKNIHNMEGIEGGMLWTPDGLAQKMKTRFYLRRHKALSALSVEKNAFAAVVQEHDDDIVQALPNEQGAFLSTYAQQVRQRLFDIAQQAKDEAEQRAHLDQKSAFQDVQNNIPKHMIPVVMMALRGKDPLKGTIGIWERNLSSAQKVENLKTDWDIPRWSPPKGMFLKE